MPDVHLSDRERASLWNAGDHGAEVCDCTGSDWTQDGTWCQEALDVFAAAEAIVAARVRTAQVGALRSAADLLTVWPASRASDLYDLAARVEARP